MTTLLALVLSLFVTSLAHAQTYFPPSEGNGGWRRLVPRSAIPTAQQKADVLAICGLNWDTLHQAKLRSDQLTTSTAIIVIRHGWICYEWGRTSNYLVHSVTKSFTGISMGKFFELTGITPDQLIYGYFPPAFGDSDPRKRQITFNQFMTMTSGIEPRDGPSPTPLANINDAYIYPMQADPGTEWAYSSLTVNLLSVLIQNNTGQSLRTYFNSRILNPIGVPSISSSNWATWFGYTMGAAGAKISARNIARLGYLLLNQGNWNGVPILTPETVSYLSTRDPALDLITSVGAAPGSTPDPSLPLFYGRTLWTNSQHIPFGDTVPLDAYFMHGFNDNLTVVIPSLDTVIVRLSGGGGSVDRLFVKDFVSLIAGAVVQ